MLQFIPTLSLRRSMNVHRASERPSLQWIRRNSYICYIFIYICIELSLRLISQRWNLALDLHCCEYRKIEGNGKRNVICALIKIFPVIFSCTISNSSACLAGIRYQLRCMLLHDSVFIYVFDVNIPVHLP